MNRRPPIQISIPQPCHEDWDKMTQQDKGRFCDSCQKCVVDFTGYTDEQLYRFIQAHSGQQICGRVSTHQLNRPIGIPHQPHSTLYKWMMAAGLTLMFTAASGNKVFAQAPLVIQTTAEHSPNIKANKKTSGGKTYTITGTVYGDDGLAVVGAKLVFKRNDIIEGETFTTIDGSFSYAIKTGNYILYLSHPGYDLPQLTIVNQKKCEGGERLNLTLKKKEAVVGYIVSENEWAWNWKFFKIPLESPPQD